MDHSKKIKPLSKKLESSIMKNETPRDLEKYEIFNIKTKAQMLLGISEGKPLKNIMKVLSRWYDMDMTIENKDFENEKVIGAFNKRLPIEDILASIKNTNSI